MMGVLEMDIKLGLSEFTQLMLDFKQEISNTLSINIMESQIEQIRIEAKGRYRKERFKDYFVKKTTLHILFKYIFIRMCEDAQKLVNPKFNKEGIRNWNEMSKNYRRDYYTLFNIASEDIRRTKEVGEIFEHSIYDDYIDKLIYKVFNKESGNYFENLKEYDFKTLDPNAAASLLEKLYPNEEREMIQDFLEESIVTTYLMRSLGLL